MANRVLTSTIDDHVESSIIIGLSVLNEESNGRIRCMPTTGWCST